MTKKDIDALFGQFPNIKVGVIGDVMLDTYWWGHVERISPEAPVPVVALDQKEQRIGGAGNVALNLASLGAKVNILSVVGADDDGAALTTLFAQHHIQTGYLLSSDTRITTNKTRIISRNQHMLRLDAEITRDLDLNEEELLLQKVRTYIDDEKPNVIIFEDYNKGVLTPRVIETVIGWCLEKGIITTVDPKRKNFFAYKQVTIFKPNLKEVKEGLNLLLEKVDNESLHNIHELLRKELNHSISFITLSEKGVFYQEGDSGRIIPCHIRNIADVSGAGDTVIAVASLVYAITRDNHTMAAIANIAGGLVCEEVGTVAINKEQLLNESRLLLATS